MNMSWDWRKQICNVASVNRLGAVTMEIDVMWFDIPFKFQL